jgi:hypothetical protein
VRLRGIDLVLEGEAYRVVDAPILERVAAVYRTGGWPASVEGDALTAPYSAPSAGPAPWHLYRLTPHTAVGVAGAEPHGATISEAIATIAVPSHARTGRRWVGTAGP